MTWSSDERDRLFCWYMPDFSNHLVCINPTPFSQSSTNSHSDLPPSNQPPIHWTKSQFFFIFIWLLLPRRSLFCSCTTSTSWWASQSPSSTWTSCTTCTQPWTTASRCTPTCTTWRPFWASTPYAFFSPATTPQPQSQATSSTYGWWCTASTSTPTSPTTFFSR